MTYSNRIFLKDKLIYEQGFTLVELVITLAILSVLIAYAVPNMYHFYANNRLWVHTHQLGQLLTLARSEAIKRNNGVVICPATYTNHCTKENNWQTHWIMFEDHNGNSQWDIKEPLLKRINFSNTPIDIHSSRKSPITFHSSGKSAGSNATITFCDSRGADYAQAVILSNSGRYRISENKNSGKPLNC